MSGALTAWARLLVESLAAAGVRDVVVSPGSRNTPFVWAALESSRLCCHTIIDERSAGFLALGQARISGAPSLLICTSGSAGANYLPAVVEAAASGTPLLVLTADRPFELMDCSAPQTIDQTRLFGAHARRFVELGMPDADPDALSALQRQAAAAVLASRYPDPGPVHLNARARKPLEPGRDAALDARVDALLEHGPTRAGRPRQLAGQPALDGLAEACAGARSGLLVCGPQSPAAAIPQETIARLARATGFAVFAEATSQQRFSLAPQPGVALLDAGPWLLEPGRRAPDLVLQIGAPPTAAAWDRFLAAHPRLARHVIAERGWPDPRSSATGLLLGDPASNLEALASALETRARQPGDSPWVRSMLKNNQQIWSIVEEELGAPDGRLCEPGAVRMLVEALPQRSVLVVGNSLPVRELDLYCRARSGGPVVCSQRGANGIDGLISGAAGAALSAGVPTTLLLGDVSFLHDIGGLYAARSVPVPFTIAVLDNGGGRIFEQLPFADLPGVDGARLQPWLTPHGFDLSHAAALYGLDFARATTPAELRRVLASAPAAPRVVDIVVPPHSARDTQRRIRTRIERELEGPR
jgi:2-succinyl-5-enolpyruvyl-6-hydroxy-3-cyclohexene-1-carboxylate synthase